MPAGVVGDWLPVEEHIIWPSYGSEHSVLGYYTLPCALHAAQ